MAAIQISSLIITPPNINSPGKVTFDFDVTGNIGAPLKIVYTIGAVYACHFVPGDPGNSKTITDLSKTLTASPMHITFSATIANDTAASAGLITITVFVQDTVVLSSDSTLGQTTIV